MSSELGNRLKEVRKIMSLNQEQFAKDIGISRAHVSNMENGNDNPSSALLKLICMKYNIEESWLINGDGDPIRLFDPRTDKGVIDKYHAMRVLFEQKLRNRTGEDLFNTVEAFSFFDAIMSPRKLTDSDKSKYLAYICDALDEYEKIIFAVSVSSKSLLPPKNDTKSWLEFKKECETRLDTVVDDIKKSINLYLALLEEDIKL